jgi:hypothetical protein
MSLTFDNKLQASSYNLSKNNQAIMQKSYEYYADGSLRYVGDQLDVKRQLEVEFDDN